MTTLFDGVKVLHGFNESYGNVVFEAYLGQFENVIFRTLFLLYVAFDMVEVQSKFIQFRRVASGVCWNVSGSPEHPGIVAHGSSLPQLGL